MADRSCTSARKLQTDVRMECYLFYQESHDSRSEYGQSHRTHTEKYSKLALEDCCKLAIDTNHISYSFIKNSIAAVAEEIGSAGFNTKLNEERNKGAFVMSPHAGDIDRLLSKSSKLAGEVRDEEA